MSAANVVRRDRSAPLRDEEVTQVLGLADDAAAHDGAPALSEAFRLGVEALQVDGVTHVLALDGEQGPVLGYAQVRDGAPGEPPSAELVVAPGHRRAGVGTALLASLPQQVRAWSHGSGDAGAAATRFAAANGLEPVRALHVMGRSLTDGPAWPPADVPERYVVRTFEPGRDEDAWLALNAAAFAHHPEQGSLTRADLDQRMRQPWWDPEGLILVVDARHPDRLVASHWTKVDPPDGAVGEVYVVAVSPQHQGEGLGRAVTVLGLDHLRSRGLERVILYVDEDNAAAVRTYRGLGFRDLEVHRQFARPAREPRLPAPPA
jgi:mycothiol synthase